MELKNNKIRVRCLECKEQHFIEMKLIGTDKQQRSISFEYEYTFKGDILCSICDEKLIVELIVFEYPKETFNYVEVLSENCLNMEVITEDYFSI